MKYKIVLILMIAALPVGCASSYGVHVSLPDIDKPVSMSRVVSINSQKESNRIDTFRATSDVIQTGEYESWTGDKFTSYRQGTRIQQAIRTRTKEAGTAVNNLEITIGYFFRLYYITHEEGLSAKIKGDIVKTGKSGVSP